MSDTEKPMSSPDDPKPVKQGSGAIPDFIKLGQIGTTGMMKIETDLLEPVVFNDPSSSTVDGFVRFELQNKGFLHSNSKLFVSYIPPVSRGGVNVCTGIGQLIKKAVLKVGNQTLNEIQDWSFLHQLKSSLLSGEIQREREQYTTGRCMDHQFIYTATGGANTNNNLAGSYGLCNGREYSSGEAGLLMQPFAVMNNTSASLIAESPVYQIDLSDLFPFLKQHQLPLYMFKEAISIELTLHPSINHRGFIANGQANSQPFLVDRNELKFCADYLYFGDGSEMSDYAEANKDLSFSFPDYRLASSSVSQAGMRNIVRNVGMANRLVSRVLTCFNQSGQGETSLAGTGVSFGLAKSGTGVLGDIEFNLRYNDRFEFPTNVQNTARLFSLLTDAEGVPFITEQEYSNAGNIITGGTYEGRVQGDGLEGNFFFQSTRLTGGRVGSRGIEVHIKANDLKANVNVMRSFCEYLRIARLQDGFIEVYNV
jgi:hypothetical protein